MKTTDEPGKNPAPAKPETSKAPRELKAGDEVLLVVVTNPNAVVRRIPAKVTAARAGERGQVLTVTYVPEPVPGRPSDEKREPVVVEGVVPAGSRSYPCWERPSSSA